MILEPVKGVRVRLLMKPGLGGWIAGAIICFVLATYAGTLLRSFVWG